jgi:GntR family transcriptional regulator of vanillate catabolism
MNLQETVLMQLRDLILRGTFEPGQRLAEQQLAERLGASRTPVRSALVTLEQEGLIEASDTGKYLVRQFTPREVADAIAVRGHLEGMAARLVAEHGVSRQLQGDLQACLEAGDRLLADNPLTLESYAAYAGMNDRFHALILDACGNRALQRAVALNDKLPFAPRRPCCRCRAPWRWTATGCSTPTASTTCCSTPSSAARAPVPRTWRWNTPKSPR